MHTDTHKSNTVVCSKLKKCYMYTNDFYTGRKMNNQTCKKNNDMLMTKLLRKLSHLTNYKVY